MAKCNQLTPLPFKGTYALAAVVWLTLLNAALITIY